MFAADLAGRLLRSCHGARLAQRCGLDVVRRTFESPIPDLDALADAPEHFWTRRHPMRGVDLNVDGQLKFMTDTLAPFAGECDWPLHATDRPWEYFIRNNAFGFISAAVLHCAVRATKPRRIVEVGSGNSTFVSARAALMNAEEGDEVELVAVEPYARRPHIDGFPGLTRLIRRKVEDVHPGVFGQLGPGDILFIDSSHVIRTGGDVNYLYLEVLPALQPGVLIHLHDIFLPYEYPKSRIIDRQTFWSEQYLLHAFLAYNSAFSVRWAGSLLYREHLDALREAFPAPEGMKTAGETETFDNDDYRSSSFWIKKIA